MRATEILLSGEEVLQIHNDYRSIHDSPPLQLNQTLNNIAQQFAYLLLRIRGQRELPEGNAYYGKLKRYDNLKKQTQQLLEYWYNQNRCYSYTKKMTPGNLKYVRNFVLLVWKESKYLGVGYAFSNEKYSFVCVYKPEGNIEIDSEIKRNVTPPKKKDQSENPSNPEHNEHSELQELGESKNDKILWPELKYLYAVPSESVRVWAIWLSRVCEIADEWQKCLRSNADLMTSMFEQMRKTREIVPEKKPKEDLYVLPMTKDEIKLWDDFPRQAALYRTYYEHWKEIGYRASTYIANRPVMDAMEHRATKNDEALDVPADASRQLAQYSMRQTESAVAHPTEETTEASEAVTETSIGIDSATVAPEQDFADTRPIALSDDQSDRVAEISVAEKTSEIEEAKFAEEERSDALEREKEPTGETAMEETPASETPTKEEIPTSETATEETPASETPTKEEIPTSETATEETPASETPTKEEIPTSETATEETSASETEEETPMSKTAAATIETTKAIEPSVSILWSKIVAITHPEIGIEKRKAAEKLIRDTGDFATKDHQSYPDFFYLRATKAYDELIEQHTDEIKKHGLERIYDFSRGTWLYYNLLDS